MSKEEAVTILLEMQEICRNKTYIENEEREEWKKEVRAIETVLKELNNSISKDKILEKIEEIKNNPNDAKQKVNAMQIDASLISCLKQLLKESEE